MSINDDEIERRINNVLKAFVEKHPGEPLPSRRSLKVIIKRKLEQRLEDGDTLPAFVKTRRL